MGTTQKKREAGSLPYALIHAQVQQKNEVINSALTAVGTVVLNPEQLTLNALVFEAEHKNRWN